MRGITSFQNIEIVHSKTAIRLPLCIAVPLLKTYIRRNIGMFVFSFYFL